MSATQKKVLVRTLHGTVYAGYLPSTKFHASGSVTLLDPDGNAKSLQLIDICWIAYVKDFNRHELEQPEQLGRRSFLARPRSPGLWLRMTFPDGSTLEGIAEPDLPLVRSLAEDAGFFITPPDPKANTYRLFIPASAPTSLEMLAVIGRSAPRRTRPEDSRTPQAGLFEDEEIASQATIPG